MLHEPTRRTRATHLQASSLNLPIWTRAGYPFLYFGIICCVILASVAVFLVFPASASAGPDIYLRFSINGLGSKKLHLYKIGSLTATELVDKFSAFSVFFISSRRPTGSARLEGGKIPRVCAHTWRLVYPGIVCRLAGRRTTAISNRKGKHTGMRVVALVPADVGAGRGGWRIKGSLWRTLREDLWSSLRSY